MIDTINESAQAIAEATIERDGIEFKLDISMVSDRLYLELMQEMLEHIGNYTDTPVKYIADWDVAIKAKTISFEGSE